MKDSYQMYINGIWCDAHDRSRFADVCPYTEEELTRVANGGRSDAQRAVNAAAAAFPGWAGLPPSQKRLLLLKAAELLEKRRDELVALLAAETGAARPFALYQAVAGPNYLREAASQVHRVTGSVLPSEGSKLSFVLRQPVGVVLGITPWNCPVVLGLRAICFAIAYGNTVVLKPSEETPVSGGIVLAEVFEEAGFPPGVLNVVTHGHGQSADIADVCIQDKRVSRISFTGSTRVGRELAEKCGRHLKKVSLELGGSDPLLVLSDADIDYAVQAAIFGRFLHQGQVCMCSKRLIVDKQVASQFTDKLVARAASLKVGDPADPATIIGPLINRRQLVRLSDQVAAALADGAQLLCGGSAEGLCYYPTVLANVTETMQVFQQETFGPVASVIIAEDTEDALRLANDSAYGLSAGIITGNAENGLMLAERLATGSVHINDSSLYGETHAPMGGMHDSGWGRFGVEALAEFTEQRWVTMQKGKRSFPF